MNILLDKIKAELEVHKSTIEKTSNDDVIFNKLKNLLSGKTGNEPTDDELKQIADERKKRYDNKISPGFMDDNKSGNTLRKYGDLIIWKELTN